MITAANTYLIRIATDADNDTLRRLAEEHSTEPLDGCVLIGEIDGHAAAALSLTDGRVIAEDSPRVAHLLATMRMRAIGAGAYAARPPLNERLLAGLPTWYRASVVRPSAAEEHTVERAEEREPALV
jgi:hypothetical protein